MDESEALFRVNSVEQLKEMEKKTRDDVENKKTELRALVGGKYREFLDSADTIIMMGQTAQNVVSHFHKISSVISTKIEQGGKSVTPKARADREKYRQWHSAGALVKFIVDTREQIWMALESQHYTDAAFIYLVATSLCSNLTSPTNAQGRTILANFTFVPQQSKSITEFRTQILEAARNRIYVPGVLTEDYADSLGAISLLEGWGSHKIVSEFYALRKISIDTILQSTKETSIANPNQSQNIAVDTLSKAIDMIYFSVYEATILFSNIPWSTSSEPLFTSLIHAILHSQPYAFTKDGPTKRWAGNKTIANVIQGHRPKMSTFPASFASCLQSFDFQALGRLSLDWVVGVMELLVAKFPGLSCKVTRGSELAKIGSLLLQKIYAPADTGFMSKILTNPPSWKEICELMFGQTLNIWTDYLKLPFIERAKEIMKERLLKLDCSDYVNTEFQEIDSHPEKNVSLGSLIWSESRNKEVITDADLHCKSMGCTDKLSAVCAYIDDFLKDVYDDMQPLLALESESLFESTKKLSLQAQFQETVLSALLSLSNQLKSTIDGLKLTASTAKGDGDKERAVSKILFVGRLAKLIPLRCDVISRIFYSQGGQNTRSGPANKKVIRKKGASTALDANYAQVSNAFRSVYLSAHDYWIQVTYQSIEKTLESELKVGGWKLFSKYRMWEEMMIGDSDSLDASDKVLLPTQASPFIINFMFGICQHILSAGGHTVDKTIVISLKRSLAVGLLKKMTDYVKSLDETSTLENDSFTQMFFDVRLLFTILHYPRPRLATLAVDIDREYEKLNEKEADKWSEDYLSLMDDVKSKIDPVEFALFEMKLLESIQRYYHRTTTFFGPLSHLNQAKDSKQQVSTPSGQSNILQRASVASRFSYLPVTSFNISDAPSKENSSNPGSDSSASTSSKGFKENGSQQKAYDDPKAQAAVGGFTSLFATAQKSTTSLFSTLTSAGNVGGNYVAQRWTTGK